MYNFKWIICIMKSPSLAPKVNKWEKLWKREWKDCQIQQMMEFAVRLCLLTASEATPILTLIDMPPIVDRERTKRLQS